MTLVRRYIAGPEPFSDMFCNALSRSAALFRQRSRDAVSLCANELSDRPHRVLKKRQGLLCRVLPGELRRLNWCMGSELLSERLIG